jgi:hypothetical protein
MANPVDSEQYISSREKSQTGRGQTSSQQPSSTREKSLPIIPKVAPPNADPSAGDGWQTRDVGKSDVPIKATMRNRSGEGPVIAPKLDHKQ